MEDAAGSPQVTKYYVIAGWRVAMDGLGGSQYLLTDHLGSFVAVTDASGVLIEDSEQRYMPFGEPRLEATLSTDFGYTGQRALEATGLMDYNARWYDAALGRFLQPDTIVILPYYPQNLNRFSYVLNNPVSFNDPSGHCIGILAGLDTLACVTTWVVVGVGIGFAAWLFTPQGQEFTASGVEAVAEMADYATDQAIKALSFDTTEPIKDSWTGKSQGEQERMMREALRRLGIPWTDRETREEIHEGLSTGDYLTRTIDDLVEAIEEILDTGSTSAENDADEENPNDTENNPFEVNNFSLGVLNIAPGTSTGNSSTSTILKQSTKTNTFTFGGFTPTQIYSIFNK